MIVLAVALATSALPVPAVVQSAIETETGSRIGIPRRARIPNALEMSEVDRARVVMAEFARCIVDRSASRLDRALAQSYSGEFTESAKMLTTNECLSAGMITFKPVALRGPLFTELYRRRAAAEARQGKWGPVAQKIDLVAASASDNQKQYLAQMEFADCVVRQNPVAAKAFVLAPTASASQDKVVQTLAPSLGPCLTAGTKVRVGKNMLEGALAEVLYREVVTAPEAAK